MDLPGHYPFPQVPLHKGAPLLSAPKLVSITFPGYPFTEQEVAFEQWIVTSDWLHQVGTEYGIGPGTFLGNVVVDAGVPDSDSALQTLIGSLIESGPLPPADANTVYAAFIPLNAPLANLYCASGASSYHSQSFVKPGFPYIVVFDCSPDVDANDGAQYVGALESHEFIEAATNPEVIKHPAYQFDHDSSWYLVGGEIADLCAADWIVDADAGFLVQRVWSNIAAADGGVAPCVPGTDFDVATQMPDAGQFVPVPIGSSATVALVGWAPQAVASWPIKVLPIPPPYSAFTLTASISQATVGVGETVELTVGVPSSAAPGQKADVLLIYGDPSSASQQFRWVIGVEAQ